MPEECVAASRWLVRAVAIAERTASRGPRRSAGKELSSAAASPALSAGTPACGGGDDGHDGTDAKRHDHRPREQVSQIRAVEPALRDT